MPAKVASLYQVTSQGGGGEAAPGALSVTIEGANDAERAGAQGESAPPECNPIQETRAQCYAAPDPQPLEAGREVDPAGGSPSQPPGRGGGVVCQSGEGRWESGRFVNPAPDCGQMLRRMLRPTPSPRVVVLGDSVTKRWFLQLLGALGPCNVTRDYADDRPRHSLLRFMGLEQAANSEWIPPVAGVEGPTVFKAPIEPFKTMLGCDDGGCNHDYAQSWQCGGAAAATAEYLPVEFARDVEFPVLAGQSPLSPANELIASSGPCLIISHSTSNGRSCMSCLQARRLAEPARPRPPWECTWRGPHVTCAWSTPGFMTPRLASGS